MPYEFYKVMHIFGLILAIGGIGAIALHALISAEKKFPLKRPIMIFHGVGVFLMLVSGFGLMAKIGMMGSGWPAWIIIKLFVWVFILGMGPTIALRAPKARCWFWWAFPIAISIAIIAAVYKTQFI